MSVVKLPSRIAEYAFLYPSATARRNALPARSSSLIRSFIITLASTIPNVNTIPAIPATKHGPKRHECTEEEQQVTEQSYRCKTPALL